MQWTMTVLLMAGVITVPGTSRADGGAARHGARSGQATGTAEMLPGQAIWTPSQAPSSRTPGRVDRGRGRAGRVGSAVLAGTAAGVAGVAGAAAAGVHGAISGFGRGGAMVFRAYNRHGAERPRELPRNVRQPGARGFVRWAARGFGRAAGYVASRVVGKPVIAVGSAINGAAMGAGRAAGATYRGMQMTMRESRQLVARGR